MVRLTQSLAAWLFQNHPDKVATIMFGHLEDFTPEMQREYLDWVQTDEGKQYLKGGAKYNHALEIDGL